MWTMILKYRYESDELKMMNLLEHRMEFTEKEKHRLFKLRKGYEGEVKYDEWMQGLEIEHLTVNDLLLEVNETTFQIDSSLIAQNTLYIFEVKNNEGDYYYEEERMKKLDGTEINDPLLQLERTTSLLRQLLKSLGFHLEINSFIVFINPEFTLYQAPKNPAIILPSQLNRFMKKLNKKQSKLNSMHNKLAEKLMALHKVDNPYKRIPVYEYEKLKKGIVSRGCHCFLDTVVKRDLVSSHCGKHEKMDEAVLRSVEEIKLLFPEKKITTALVYEWCNGAVPLKTVRRILNANFVSIGERHTRHFQ